MQIRFIAQNISRARGSRGLPLVRFLQVHGRESVTNFLLVAAAVLVTGLPLIAQGNRAPQAAQPQPATKAAPPANPDRGQQVFEQNCSRCHLPPQGFSPRISGTIALHMRTRANLSAADYKALLHFLNP